MKNVTVKLVNRTEPLIDKLVNKTAPFVGSFINKTREILKGPSESSTEIPQFLINLGANAQRDYWNIMNNKTLTKAQMRNNLLAWSNKTGTYVNKNFRTFIKYNPPIFLILCLQGRY